jgi:hypothetical protein
MMESRDTPRNTEASIRERTLIHGRRSRRSQVLAYQGELADALACCGEDGIEHRRRRHEDSRLAGAFPNLPDGITIDSTCLRWDWRE